MMMELLVDTVQSLDVGDVEVVRFSPPHPAIMKSLSIYFGSVGAPTTIYIWGDNGGIWADYDNDGFLDFYATCHNYLPTCSTDKPCAADGYSCVDGGQEV